MAQSNAGNSGRKSSGRSILRQDGSASSTASSTVGTASASGSEKALSITFAREMRAHRGKLSFGPGPGNEVFAASFLARREIVFDAELLGHAPDFVSIVTHEIYHFVWRRLPNAERSAWGEILRAELRPRHAGLSSRLRYTAYCEGKSERQWKDYVCEAFCDTAAALTSPTAKIPSHRKRWFGDLINKRRLPV